MLIPQNDNYEVRIEPLNAANWKTQFTFRPGYKDVVAAIQLDIDEFDPSGGGGYEYDRLWDLKAALEIVNRTSKPLLSTTVFVGRTLVGHIILSIVKVYARSGL